MSLMDILQHYTHAPSAPGGEIAHEHFDEVARAAPPATVGQGGADACRSDRTPPFGEMVGCMYGQSDPQQQAGVLNHLLRSVGGGTLASLGGIPGRLSDQGTQSVPQLTPEQASRLTPEQVKEIATRAEQHDPTIVDKVGGFYAEHPDLVKTLGSAALAIALAGVANRIRRQ